MSIYLFVTTPDHAPERVEGEVDVPWWSCSSTTATGDRALVYVTEHGIKYEWSIVSDAEPDEEWKYVCDVEHTRTFNPPITIREIRDAVPKDDWAPPYQNFRGVRSIIVPDRVAGQIRALRPVVAPGAKVSFLPEEVVDDSGLAEGAVRRVSLNAYERNPEARRTCIEHYGPSCSICAFNFEVVYGDIAKDYIHVHHLRPLSEIGGEYVVDPVEDLRPVCPNCHAVLHRRSPAYTIEDVRAFLQHGASGTH